MVIEDIVTCWFVVCRRLNFLILNKSSIKNDKWRHSWSKFNIQSAKANGKDRETRNENDESLCSSRIKDESFSTIEFIFLSFNMTERRSPCEESSSTSIEFDSKENFLFDPLILKSTLEICTSKIVELSGNIYAGRFCLRPLSIEDFHRGFFDLLRQLTECGNVDSTLFETRFNEMKLSSGTYFVLVVEDLHADRKVVASATLVCEKKFIRQLAKRARIEDVVVSDLYRGKHLGKLLIEILTQFSKEHLNCYKVSLECKDDLVSFYRQFGYAHEEKQNYLCQRFPTVTATHWDKLTDLFLFSSRPPF